MTDLPPDTPTLERISIAIDGLSRGEHECPACEAPRRGITTHHAPNCAVLVLADCGKQLKTAEQERVTLRQERDALLGQIAEFEARPWPGCRMLTMGEFCECSLCKTEQDLAATRSALASAQRKVEELEAELKAVKRERDHLGGALMAERAGR